MYFILLIFPYFWRAPKLVPSKVPISSSLAPAVKAEVDLETISFNLSLLVAFDRMHPFSDEVEFSTD